MGIQRRAILNRSRGLSALALAGATLGPAAVACGPAQGQPGTSTEGQAQTPAGNPVKGGTYTEAVFGDAKTLQPLLSQDAPSNSFISLHYNAFLLRRNEDTLELDTKHGTAESFQVSPDGLTVTYKLKPNVQWSDGRPITSADYKFTYDKMLDPKVDYPYRNNFREFESLTAPDERTLVFRLKEAFCPAIEQSNLNPIPKHIFENQDINDSPLNQKPTVGSGPWLLQEWVKDDHATFIANDKFYLGRPNLDRHVFRIVADQNVIYAMVKAQEVDSGTVKAEDWEEVKTLKHLQPLSYYPVAASWVYFGFNMRRDELKDVRVRQALSYAMDRQKMVERIRLGHAKPLNS
ncbi:MAG: ABC transporter substrate-binding protein, partial [Chloroflexota bacterium]|nr:ABC transporter substrate-binding protein [Chloroflexota bacterium]